MTHLYDEDVLKQINDNVDLYTYVSCIIELEKRGDDYFGHCPLHIDRTPSFSINPEENKYYCFSCGRGGGIIRFLMDFEDLRFSEALEKAASLANIDLKTMCHSQTIAFLKKIKAINRHSEPYEHIILPDSEYQKYSKEPAEEWLNEGIEQDVMDLFGVRIDNLHNRIVYPVYDIHGNLINIKARTRYPNYKELRLPKYINYFPVGCMDYLQGLHITLPYVKEQGEIIIFESVKSVMKAFGWGYTYCASAEKHTLTKEQIALLVSMRVNITLAYDSDVSYRCSDVKQNIDKLKRVTNVYIIDDKEKLLGGIDAKNAPVDCGKEIWEALYKKRRKVV